MSKMPLLFLAFTVTLFGSAVLPVDAADDADTWSKPVNGLQARLSFSRKDKLNGTPIITTYLELRHVSNDSDVIELPLDGGDVAFNFTVTDSDGKAVSATGGPFHEITPDLGLVRLPFDSLLRVNIAHRGASVPKDFAAHIDLGAEAAIDRRAVAPAVWDFKRA